MIIYENDYYKDIHNERIIETTKVTGDYVIWKYLDDPIGIPLSAIPIAEAEVRWVKDDRPIEDIFPCNSSSLLVAVYRWKEESLALTFRGNRDYVYLYVDVPNKEWSKFKNSGSKGQFYEKEIKGFYKSYKVLRTFDKIEELGDEYE